MRSARGWRLDHAEAPIFGVGLRFGGGVLVRLRSGCRTERDWRRPPDESRRRDGRVANWGRGGRNPRRGNGVDDEQPHGNARGSRGGRSGERRRDVRDGGHRRGRRRARSRRGDTTAGDRSVCLGGGGRHHRRAISREVLYGGHADDRGAERRSARRQDRDGTIRLPSQSRFALGPDELQRQAQYSGHHRQARLASFEPDGSLRRGRELSRLREPVDWVPSCSSMVPKPIFRRSGACSTPEAPVSACPI